MLLFVRCLMVSLALRQRFLLCVMNFLSLSAATVLELELELEPELEPEPARGRSTRTRDNCAVSHRGQWRPGI